MARTYKPDGRSFWIDRPEVKLIAQEGHLQPLDVEHCIAFDEYFCREHQWATNRLDWSIYPEGLILEVPWLSCGPEELASAIDRTVLAEHQTIAIIFSVYEPGLIGDYEFITRSIHRLLRTGRMVHYLCGVNDESDGRLSLVLQS